MGQKNQLVAVGVGAVLLMGAAGWIVGSAWRKEPAGTEPVEVVSAAPEVLSGAKVEAAADGKAAVAAGGVTVSNPRVVLFDSANGGGVANTGEETWFYLVKPLGRQPVDPARLEAARAVAAAQEAELRAAMAENQIREDQARVKAAEAELRAALESRRLQVEAAARAGAQGNAGGPPDSLAERTGRAVKPEQPAPGKAVEAGVP